jgi:hypothetical protein
MILTHLSSVLLVTPLLLLPACSDNGSSSGDPEGQMAVAIKSDDLQQDSLQLSPVFERLPDSAENTPGPQRFRTSIRISGTSAPPDSFRFQAHILDQGNEIGEEAYVVRKLTTMEEQRGGTAILVTPDQTIYNTQFTEDGEAAGTIVVNEVRDQVIRGELKAVKLSTGFYTLTLSGTFRAVKAE